MQTLRQIVAGSDFSACADHALELAIRLAAAVGAQVTVVHVCDLDLDDDQRSRERMAALLYRYRDVRVPLSGVLRCGKPWTKLDNVAADTGASLIVAGRGHEVELGSVAEKLVRCASRPVLTVPCDLGCPGAEPDTTERQQKEMRHHGKAHAQAYAHGTDHDRLVVVRAPRGSQRT